MPRMGTLCPLGIRYHPLVGTTTLKSTSWPPGSNALWAWVKILNPCCLPGRGVLCKHLHVLQVQVSADPTNAGSHLPSTQRSQKGMIDNQCASKPFYVGTSRLDSSTAAKFRDPRTMIEPKYFYCEVFMKWLKPWRFESVWFIKD
jgi:hypothetical protein